MAYAPPLRAQVVGKVYGPASRGCGGFKRFRPGATGAHGAVGSHQSGCAAYRVRVGERHSGSYFYQSVAGHSYTYSWSFGDGSAPTAAAAISNFNDISSTHIYPGPIRRRYPRNRLDGRGHRQRHHRVAPVHRQLPRDLGKQHPAITRERGHRLGLWYLHQDMYHSSATTGSWAKNCASGYPAYACGSGYGSLDATNVQAFEVNATIRTDRPPIPIPAMSRKASPI